MSETSEKRRKNGRDRLLRRMEALAEGRVNDAVKLAFLDSGLERERLEEIDKLELGALAEFKRSGNGSVEVKLLDRMAALEKLIALTGGGEGDAAESFFRALEQRAEGGSGGGV